MTSEVASPTDPPQVTVVFPCLNEAASVGPCVEEAMQAFDGSGLRGEVVVVDNGSTDGSAHLAREAGARVVHEPVPGYGSALRAGFADARGEVIVMADADSTYPLHKLAQLVEPVLTGDQDLMVGSRLDEANRESMPFLHRYLGTPVITYLTARACGRRVVSDSQSGFRAFRRADLPRLALTGDGMELATEMLLRASRSGMRISEVATGYRPRVGESKLNTWSDGWRHLMLLLMLAPDLLLIGPGLILTALGLITSVLAFTAPSGLEIGSLRWQPVFFSGVTLVLGIQAVFAGALIADRTGTPVGGRRGLTGIVDHPSFRRRSLAVGAGFLATGLGLNLVMLIGWLGGDESGPARLGLASLSQSLMIVGGTVAYGAVVSHFMLLGRSSTTTTG